MKLEHFVYITCFVCTACDESGPAARAADAGSNDAGAANFESGTPLEIDVAADHQTYITLDPPAVVDPSVARTTGWDLAFGGYDVHTNSGPSGPGQAAAFGPLDDATFLLDEAPNGLPFLAQDKSGGAFLDWYFYDGTSHYLWSRLHTLGVKEGDRLWKVQLVTYYGERNGGPVSALYKLRYAELTDAGIGPTQTVTLDGTAGGTSAPSDSPSGCIDLGTGGLVSHTPAEAATTSDWHLCARRDFLSVNGGISGPRGATSVDADSSKTAAETLAQVQKRTETSELAAFDAFTKASFASLEFTPDGVVSAFRDLWVDRTSSPPARGTGAWVVKGATSEQRFLVGFPAFEGATPQTPTHITARIKKVGGSAQ